MNQPSSLNPTASQQYGAFLLRLALGVMWIAHALLKWFVFTLAGTAQYFESIGFLGSLAYPVFLAELLGGIALVLGLYARQVALLLVPSWPPPHGCMCLTAGFIPAWAAVGSIRCS